MGKPGTAAGPTAAGDLSDFGGCKGWFGRKCSDGRAGDALRSYQRPRDLVSDQPFVCWILSGKSDHGADCNVSLGRTDHCSDPPPDVFFTGGASVWRGTSHVSAAANSVWRHYRSHSVVWPDPYHAGSAR